jgi:hypothetical protein
MQCGLVTKINPLFLFRDIITDYFEKLTELINIPREHNAE